MIKTLDRYLAAREDRALFDKLSAARYADPSRYTLERYQELVAPSYFWEMVINHPERLAVMCNGVGSKTSWTYPYTPDTIWLLDVTPAADIHDVMFTEPLVFPAVIDGVTYTAEKYFQHANNLFYCNLMRLFDKADAQSWLSRRVRRFRNMRAREYKFALDYFGFHAFMEGKNHPDTTASKYLEIERRRRITMPSGAYEKF